MSDIGDLISVGLLGERNGLGLTANEAHAVGERIASHLPGLTERERDGWIMIVERWKRIAEEAEIANSLDAAWADAKAAADGQYIALAGPEPDGTYRAECGLAFTVRGQPTPAAALRALAAKLREVGR